MNSLSSQRGQAMVMSVAFLTVLVGMAALVLDVGSWYRADRHAQITADAAALAGAQGLHEDVATATAYALDYVDKNDKNGPNAGETGLPPATVEFPASDRVKVTVQRPSPGFFANLFGIDKVDVRATATASIGTPGEALYVAPIVVNEKHPDIQSFGKATELEYYHLKSDSGKGPDTGKTPDEEPSSPDGAGSFGFINLDTSDSNPGTSVLGDWIRHGFDRYMKPGTYEARTGNPFSSTHVGASLDDKLGEELLFPIYRTLKETGSNAEYDIIGWVGFHLTGTDLTGSKEKLFGHFTKVIWTGIQGKSGSTFSPGVGVVELVE